MFLSTYMCDIKTFHYFFLFCRLKEYFVCNKKKFISKSVLRVMILSNGAKFSNIFSPNFFFKFKFWLVNFQLNAYFMG